MIVTHFLYGYVFPFGAPEVDNIDGSFEPEEVTKVKPEE